MKPLVPVSFDVPQALEHPAFRLRMLQATDAQSDYEAVMESQARLTRHEAEFRSRIAFAYTMVSPSGDRVLGCVYINPSQQADADVYLWVRDDCAAQLTVPLFQAVDDWLKHCWPFSKINYIRTTYYAAALARQAMPDNATGR
jgi:hypothetical protein